MRWWKLIQVVLLAGGIGAALAACDSAPSAPRTPLVVSQTPRPDLPLTLPTSPPEATNPATPAPTNEPPPAPPAGSALAPSVRYRVEADLDWVERSVRVVEQVDLQNWLDRALEEILFTIEANGDTNLFSVTSIKAGGAAIDDYTLNASDLIVSLPESLEPGKLLTLELTYDLTIPAIRAGYQYGHLGYLGYSGRQINLGNWIPLVAHYDAASGWVSPEPHTVGEQAVRRQADFDVRLRVSGAPDGLVAAAPGAVTQDDDEWRFVAGQMREFAVSLSDEFEVARTQTPSGVDVELYHFPESALGMNAAQHALQTASDALTLYERQFNQPYAHRRLVVVEGDFPDGMEFSGLVFVSRDWFQLWRGITNDWLTVITAHEVSHQWWYSAIGSDQGQHPYLDEALALYSELLYFEHYAPEHVAWWWDFRVNAYAPSGHADRSVYDFNAPRPYINAVYLQGARMMHDLREDLGDVPFFGWLQRYAGQMSGQIATPADFWGAMNGDEYDAKRETRERYLGSADILARSSVLP